MTFKMVNTLDSMVGYKTSRYKHFGRTSARIDDLANFIPARLSIPVITAAAHLLFGTGGRTWATVLREGGRHSSPNAGKPEAAFAGALGIKLGGPNHYNGTLVNKPYIGTQFGVAQPHHISLACQLMTLSAFLWMLVCWTCSSLNAVMSF
jgi:adenosylcobinamide-phosphate synthase